MIFYNIKTTQDKIDSFLKDVNNDIVLITDVPDEILHICINDQYTRLGFVKKLTNMDNRKKLLELLAKEKKRIKDKNKFAASQLDILKKKKRDFQHESAETNIGLEHISSFIDVEVYNLLKEKFCVPYLLSSALSTVLTIETDVDCIILRPKILEESDVETDRKKTDIMENLYALVKSDEAKYRSTYYPCRSKYKNDLHAEAIAMSQIGLGNFYEDAVILSKEDRSIKNIPLAAAMQKISGKDVKMKVCMLSNLAPCVNEDGKPRGCVSLLTDLNQITMDACAEALNEKYKSNIKINNIEPIRYLSYNHHPHCTDQLENIALKKSPSIENIMARKDEKEYPMAQKNLNFNHNSSVKDRGRF